MSHCPVEQLAPVVTDEAPRRVLIVEDDQDSAEVLSVRLERLGFRTHIAHTGSEGLDWARTQHPHLVLLDIRLPDQSGLEVCRELADGEETAGTPVIMLSGMSRPDIIRCSRAAGCQFYVRKPYDPNALLILIQQALDEAESMGVG